MTAELDVGAQQGSDAQQDTDARIILESLDDPKRFGEIYDQYAATVHRYLSRRVGTVTADDLMSETFLVAFRIRQRFDPTAQTALPWLYGIATNLLRRHRRTELAQYRTMAKTGTDPTFTDNHADRVVDQVEASGRIRLVAGALGQLTAKERNVVLLIAWGELEYEQVAVALGIPIGTVRSRLNRARRKLHDSLIPTTTKKDLP